VVGVWLNNMRGQQLESQGAASWCGYSETLFAGKLFNERYLRLTDEGAEVKCSSGVVMQEGGRSGKGGKTDSCLRVQLDATANAARATR
jgi:hypothetical protein